jgi:hypothetical protein
LRASLRRTPRGHQSSSCCGAWPHGRITALRGLLPSLRCPLPSRWEGMQGGQRWA